jgi:hypothetical protein
MASTTNTHTAIWRTILKEAIHTLRKASYESTTQKKILVCEAQNKTCLEQGVHLEKTLEVDMGLLTQLEISPPQERRPTNPQAFCPHSPRSKIVEHALRGIAIEYDELSDDEETIRRHGV